MGPFDVSDLTRLSNAVGMDVKRKYVLSCHQLTRD